MKKIGLNMMDSDQLILDIKKGNVNAFKQFFESFYPSLCLFANKYLKNSDESLDIVQDAFISIWNIRKDVHSIDSAKGYLFKYVKNRSLNYLRDQKQRKCLNFEQLNSEIFFRDNLIEEETYQIIYEAVRNLPAQGQRVIELALDGLKNQAIAEQLNVTVNTIKTIKLRAFKSMRKELKENVFMLFMLLCAAKSN
ncbi:MAG: RNA polymerase sigma-70 factor [Mariniphaga sp.]|nr:RNA polymerase sigma-70 factor [Mariniphaga sp.]